MKTPTFQGAPRPSACGVFLIDCESPPHGGCMSRNLWLRWLFSLGIGLLLGASLVTACVIFLGKAHESVLQLSQPLSQGAGTLIMAALYFWREYIGGKSADDNPAAAAVSVAPVISVTTEVTATPQIIQNIYPPSLSPPPLSRITTPLNEPGQPVDGAFASVNPGKAQAN